MRMETEPTPKSGWRDTGRKLGWFVVLWAGSVLALGAVATVIRAAIRMGP